MAADEWIWKIGNQTNVKQDPRVLEARYGGGYRQVTADGKNNALKVIEVTMNVVPNAEVKAIDDFLKGKAGASTFTWTQKPPWDVDGQKNWYCQHWTFQYVGGTYMGFSATFEEAP